MLDRVRRGYKSVFGYEGGEYGGLAGVGSMFRRLPGTQFDYRAEAGLLHDNSIVLACHEWVWKQFLQATLAVGKMNRDGSIDYNADHPALEAFKRPNPWYGRQALWYGTLLSDATDGNGYLLTLPSKGGKRAAGLLYIPHFHLQPRNDKYNEGRNKLVTYYYHVPSSKEIDPERVIHLRHGIDPIDMRRGLSPLGAALREVCQDNELATFNAAILRNGGVPSFVLSSRDDTSDSLTQEQREKVLALWADKTTGDRRGEPLVFPLPLDVKPLGFSPQQMIADKAAARPETRIPALYGISSMVIGLKAGIDRAIQANMRNAQLMSWDNCLIPTQDRFAEQLTEQLDDLLGPGEFFCFDRRRVPALQEDQDLLAKRVTILAGGPVITPNEGRAMLGIEQNLEGGDELRNTPAEEEEPAPEEPAGDEPTEEEEDDEE